MPVAIDFGRCLVMRDSLSLVQVGNCRFLMAWISVEGTGINILDCVMAERSALVDLDCMALQARFYGLLVFWTGGGGFRARRIVQRPLVHFCCLVMILLPYLNFLSCTWRRYLNSRHHRAVWLI